MTFWQKLFTKQAEQPEFVKQYLQGLEKAFEPHMPISKIRFVVIDTETNGLDPKKAELLSFGGIGVQASGIRVADSLEMTALAPEALLSEDVAVHGLMRKDVQQGLASDQLVKKLISFIDRSVLVAHHAAFDLAILNATIKKHYHFKIKNPVLDTAYLAKRLEHGVALNEFVKAEDYSLDKLCERYGIAKDDRHTAAGDALITAELLLVLLSQAQKSGIHTFSELLK
ncbi:MAG: PolC-type DNA polymerase III [Cyclobacteriaceae bacterium]